MLFFIIIIFYKDLCFSTKLVRKVLAANIMNDIL